MGRSRGGLTTKIHALVDANGLPILLKLTPGQAHDGRSAPDMLGGLGEGQILLADRGYDSDALRKSLASQGAWGNIKPMPNRVNVPAFTQAEPLAAKMQPEALLGDKGYDADAFIDSLEGRAIKRDIPPKPNPKVACDCDFALYAERNLIQRFFQFIKQIRGIATRYEKTAGDLAQMRTRPS